MIERCLPSRTFLPALKSSERARRPDTGARPPTTASAQTPNVLPHHVVERRVKFVTQSDFPTVATALYDAATIAHHQTFRCIPAGNHQELQQRYDRCIRWSEEHAAARRAYAEQYEMHLRERQASNPRNVRTLIDYMVCEIVFRRLLKPADPAYAGTIEALHEQLNSSPSIRPLADDAEKFDNGMRTFTALLREERRFAVENKRNIS